MQERVPWEQLRAGDQEHTAPEASNYQRLLELGSAVWRAWVSAQLLLPSKVTAGQYDSRTPAAQGPRRTTGTVLSRPLLAFGGQSPRCQKDTLCQGLSSQRGHSVPPPLHGPECHHIQGGRARRPGDHSPSPVDSVSHSLKLSPALQHPPPPLRAAGPGGGAGFRAQRFMDIESSLPNPRLPSWTGTEVPSAFCSQRPHGPGVQSLPHHDSCVV